MRRSFKMKFILKILLFSLPLAVSTSFADELKENDAAREWRGTEYADFLFVKVRSEFPNLQFTFDPSDLKILQIPDGPAKKPDPSYPLKERFMTYAKGALGSQMESLISTLENGTWLFIDSKIDPKGKIEAQLKAWILSQPLRSIEPDQLMARALALTDGHVFAAWAAAWNVVRNDWEYAQVRNYSDITLRLKSVTGERDQWAGAARYIVRDRPADNEIEVFNSTDGKMTKQKPLMQEVISKRGDDFSTVYHHIGVELLALVTSERRKSGLSGKLMAWTGALGEFNNYRQTAGLSGESIKRLRNDMNAGISGSRLFDLMKGKAQPPTNILATGAAYYLRPNSFLFGHRYQLPDNGTPPAYFGKNSDPSLWAPIMTVEELTLRFHHAVTFDSDVINDIVVSASNGDSDRMHRGLQAYIDSGLKNQKLNDLILEFEPTVLIEPSPRDIGIDFESERGASQAILSTEVGDFNFDDAAIHQQRMIERTQNAIRMKQLKDAADLRAMTCSAAFAN